MERLVRRLGAERVLSEDTRRKGEGLLPKAF